ncbi:MAG TPA: hypothetical protein VGM64_13965 [Lacunisphaera sp.]|jgi:hypothetical protein
MKSAALFFTLTVLISFMSCGTGCMSARRQKTETAFDRLAARSPDQIAGFLDNRLSAKLGLTADQLPRVYAVDLDYAIKIQAAAASNEGTLSKARTMEKAGDAHTSDLKEVLNADQFARFLTMKEELRTAIKEGAGTGK